MGTFLSAAWARAKLAGRQFDCLLNALFLPDAKPNETVSDNAADHQYSTKWGCVLCKVLGVLVQRDHCKKVRTNTPLPPFADLRAVFWMVVWLALVWGALRELVLLLIRMV